MGLAGSVGTGHFQPVLTVRLHVPLGGCDEGCRGSGVPFCCTRTESQIDFAKEPHQGCPWWGAGVRPLPVTAQHARPWESAAHGAAGAEGARSHSWVVWDTAVVPGCEVMKGLGGKRVVTVALRTGSDGSISYTALCRSAQPTEQQLCPSSRTKVVGVGCAMLSDGRIDVPSLETWRDESLVRRRIVAKGLVVGRNCGNC